jgi:surfeit locus 1 family protein
MTFPWRETVMAASGVAILLALGTWQVQRLFWKNDIIERLERAYDSQDALQNLEERLPKVENGDDLFAYGSLSGVFLRDKAVLLGPRMEDGRVGYHLLVPLESEGKTVIVNTGWVSDLWQDTFEERLASLPVDVQARGLLRKPDWSRFSSQNSPENNLWFRADTGEIARAKDLGQVSGAILYADRIEPPLHDVTPQAQRWLPRNKHLQYALFWYAMAGALAAVYGFYLRSLYIQKSAP